MEETEEGSKSVRSVMHLLEVIGILVSLVVVLVLVRRGFFKFDRSAPCCCCGSASLPSQSSSSNSNSRSAAASAAKPSMLEMQRVRSSSAEAEEMEVLHDVEGGQLHGASLAEKEEKGEEERLSPLESQMLKMSRMELRKKEVKLSLKYVASPEIAPERFENAWAEAGELEVWGTTLEAFPEGESLRKAFEKAHIYCLASGEIQAIQKFYFFGQDTDGPLAMFEISLSLPTKRVSIVFKKARSELIFYIKAKFLNEGSFS